MKLHLAAPKFFGDSVKEYLRITLNKRLATAAAAIVQRIINRRRPRVFRPVSPFKKGSKTSTAMFDAAGQCLMVGIASKGPTQRTDHVLRLKFKVTSSAAGLLNYALIFSHSPPRGYILQDPPSRSLTHSCVPLEHPCAQRAHGITCAGSFEATFITMQLVMEMLQTLAVQTVRPRVDTCPTVHRLSPKYNTCIRTT